MMPRPVLWAVLAVLCAATPKKPSIQMSESLVNKSFGNFGNYRYMENLCYSTRNNTWLALSEPYPGWPGVRNTIEGTRNPRFSRNIQGMGKDFRPTVVPHLPFGSPETLVVHDTSLLLFLWVAHFGHILIDQSYPAVSSLRSLDIIPAVHRPGEHVRPINVILIPEAAVERHASWHNTTVVIDYLVGHVRSNIASEIRRRQDQHPKHRYVCFKDAVVGVKKLGSDDHRYPLGYSYDHPMGGYSVFRNYVFARHGVVPRLTKTAIVVLRTKRRKFLNFDAIVNSIRGKLGPEWKVTTPEMANYPVAGQFEMMATAALLVTIVSTEAHFAIFLPDGAASIVVSHPFHHDVNEFLCNMTPTLHCFAPKIHYCEPECTNRDADVHVNVTQLEAVMDDVLKIDTITGI